jgi:hypothetical protein
MTNYPYAKNIGHPTGRGLDAGRIPSKKIGKWKDKAWT